ncbi:MAG: hypothetical protein K8W52_41895 [Deltaproteobacteria bacterium]|nr:hypothetical protein [Deltaproteobacteria bacterium]
MRARRRLGIAAVSAIAAIACGSAPVATPEARPASPAATAPDASAPTPAPPDAAPPALDPPPPPPSTAIAAEVAAARLLGTAAVPAACATDPSPIACMLDQAFAADPRAAALARALYTETGDVAGPGDAEIMDGGYRGRIQLVPALPIRGDRQHLAWVLAAARDFDGFFAGIDAALPAVTTARRYRWRDLDVRFIRSVGKHTPSAFALPWTFSYNVQGSLLTSEAAVRETLFHEIFHMNDAAHGAWSGAALRADYDAIVQRCGTTRAAIPCLTPYAPGFTKVRGGTYYAFQPNNGDPVHEFAAELALRYYVEQRQMLHAGKLARPAFKCGPPENARAWTALVDEFFGGRDLVPPCP